MRTHIVSVSSGVASAYVWHLARQRHPDAIGLFADVNFEDADNYRFLAEVHGHIGGQLVHLDNGGRDIFDVFKTERMLGNTRAAICTRILKREAALQWLADNAPASTVWFGIDWTEPHRFRDERTNPTTGEVELRGMQPLYAAHGHTAVAPMVDEVRDKTEALDWLASIGIEPPLLILPENFDRWERGEHETRVHLKTKHTILRDRRGGEVKPLSLTDLRLASCSANPDPTLFDDDAEGCACFTPEWMTQADLDLLAEAAA